MKIFTNIKEKITLLKQRPFFNFVLNKYTIAIIVFLLFICIFDTNNLGVWIRAEKTIRNQEIQIEQRNQEIESLEEKIDHLNYVQDSLEKFAREEFLFHEDGEDIYIIDEN